MKSAPKILLAVLMFATSAFAQTDAEGKVPLDEATQARIQRLLENENASSDDYLQFFNQRPLEERIALIENFRARVQELRAEINRVEALWEDPLIGGYQAVMPLTVAPGFVGLIIAGIGHDSSATKKLPWAKKSLSNKAFIVLGALSAAYMGYRFYKNHQVHIEKDKLPRLKASLNRTLDATEVLLKTLRYQAEIPLNDL